MDYYFIFHCDELGVDLECELEYDEEEPEVGLKASMTLVSALVKEKLGQPASLDILPVMRLELVDEIEAAALKEARTTGHDGF
jgi:hypothetical protein